MSTPPRFLYFDLGNVLLNFDHQRAARQMAEVAGLEPQQVFDLVFGGDLETRYERGDITTQQFYEVFCQQTKTRPDLEALKRAAADIFELNAPLAPIVGHLRLAGHRLGVLSNTNEAHWQWVSSGRYTLVPGYFDVLALSFEMGAMKPEPRAYVRAAELAGCAPGEIFFVDDRPDNVAGALAAGFDAVPFQTATQLAIDLRSRGIRFNY